MDKRKVIMAYRRGIVSLKECAQLLGVDMTQVKTVLNDPALYEPEAGGQVSTMNR